MSIDDIHNIEIDPFETLYLRLSGQAWRPHPQIEIDIIFSIGPVTPVDDDGYPIEEDIREIGSFK